MEIVALEDAVVLINGGSSMTGLVPFPSVLGPESVSVIHIGVGTPPILGALSSRHGDRTCRLVTLGCKVNQYETQLVLEALERNGFREATEDEAADLCVVNTCTVTSNGDSRSRQVIRRLRAGR